MARKVSIGFAASLMGKRGGHARAKALTPERLSEIGRKAIQARMEKRREKERKNGDSK